MPNSYYTRAFDVLPASRIGSQAIEDEFASIELGFDGVQTANTDALALKANLASPAFAGTPTVPTAATATNTTQAASTAFVKNVFSAAVAGNYANLNAETLTVSDGLSTVVARSQETESFVGTTTATTLHLTTNNLNRVSIDPAGNVALQESGGGLSNVTSINSGPLAGFRNRIINGGFDVWQRGTSVTPPLGSLTAYVSDRWAAYQTGAALAITRGSGTDGCQYAATFSGAVGNTEVTLFQCIEAANTYSFTGASAITLSAWIYSDTVKNVTLLIDSANVADVFSATTSHTNTTIAHPGTGWIKASLTWMAPGSNFQRGLRIRFNVQSCTTGNFKLTGVQLEPGSVATPFEARPYSVELAMCQRYYYRASPGINGYFGGSGWASGTTRGRSIINFNVPMRLAPSGLEQSGIATDYLAAGYGVAGTTVCSGVPVFVFATTEHAHVAFDVAAGLTTYSAGTGAAATANAFLGFSAEL